MARISAELGLTAEELDELMSTSWNMRVATHLEEVRSLMGTKYSGGHGETPSIERVRYPQTASGRSARWVVFEPSRLITWDNHKLPKH